MSTTHSTRDTISSRKRLGIPCKFYDLEKLYDWFREQGERGLRFRALHPMFNACQAEFEQVDRTVYYRIRYELPKDMEFFGNPLWDYLQVIEVDSPQESGFDPEDYADATRNGKFNWWITIPAQSISLGLHLWALYKSLLPAWLLLLSIANLVFSTVAEVAEVRYRKQLNRSGKSNVRLYPLWLTNLCAVFSVMMLTLIFSFM